jgi:hypothetical protein
MRQVEMAKHVERISKICDMMLNRLTRARNSDSTKLVNILEDTGNDILSVADEVRAEMVDGDPPYNGYPHLTVILGGRK